MILAISGTPGTGKTLLAEELAKKLGWNLVKINETAEKLKAYLGTDKKMDSKVLDMRKIKKYLKTLKGNLIVEGHAAHEIQSDILIILRCEPKILKKRLTKKYKGRPEKIKENLDAEILGVISSEAVQLNRKVYEIDTSEKTVDENIAEVLNILKGKKGHEVGKIDWLEKYESWLL